MYDNEIEFGNSFKNMVFNGFVIPEVKWFKADFLTLYL